MKRGSNESCTSTDKNGVRKPTCTSTPDFGIFSATKSRDIEWPESPLTDSNWVDAKLGHATLQYTTTRFDTFWRMPASEGDKTIACMVCSLSDARKVHRPAIARTQTVRRKGHCRVPASGLPLPVLAIAVETGMATMRERSRQGDGGYARATPKSQPLMTWPLPKVKTSRLPNPQLPTPTPTSTASGFDPRLPPCTISCYDTGPPLSRPLLSHNSYDP